MPKKNPFAPLSSYNIERALDRGFEEAKAHQIEAVGSDGNYTEEFVSDVLSNDVDVVEALLDAFQTGHFDGAKSIKEFMTQSDYPELFYTAVELLLLNTLVPERIVSQYLFSTIPYSGTASEITLRTMGGARVFEIPEGAPYPESSSAMNDQAYKMRFEFKKYGAKIGGTREMIESDNFGLFAFNVAQVGRELLNMKERKCIDLLNTAAGFTLIDNANAAATPLGTTTGRDISGAQNGAIGLDDIMNIMAYAEQRGYYIDTVLLHPFAWSLWARDPEIREVVIGKSPIYTPQGSAAPGWGDPFGPYGPSLSRFGSTIAQVAQANAQAGNFNSPDSIYKKLGVAMYAFPNLTPFGATFQTQPQWLDRPLRVLVSPLVPYYKISGGSKSGKYATNLIFADSKKCGVILQKENPVMEEWTDVEREVDFVKLRERYGMAMMEGGRSVYLAKNVVLDRTYAFENVNSRTLNPLDLTTDIV